MQVDLLAMGLERLRIRKQAEPTSVGLSTTSLKASTAPQAFLD